MPTVSVVTAVYNCAGQIPESADSVLAQHDVDFEWIVIDDGSTDGSSQFLQQLASSDPRVRLFRQTNQGLTRALVLGCENARGTFIARHDAGDLSLPGRLVKQCAFLEAHPEVAVVSCWTRVVGPQMETLAETRTELSGAEATARIQSHDPDVLIGPTHHGAVLFRRSQYLQVGGYRPAFYYAQDLDLWLRLTELGQLAFLPELLYVTRFDESCISSQRRPEQIALSRISIAAAAARKRGDAETEWLKRAEAIRPQGTGQPDKSKRAAANYWIGRMLQARKDRRANDYFRKALEYKPLSIRARLALTLSWLRLSR